MEPIEGHVKTYTINEIENMADKYFPIRDKDNKPSYREHQRETIIKIAKAFYIDNKKFVAVDGPVGCGKSAINYTVARMAGDTTYLTPLKMLQDQIAAENWEGVKMLKGRGSYACNLCGCEEVEYKCDYEGVDFKTCNNSKEKNSFDSKTLNEVGLKIKEIHDYFKYNPFIIRLKTAFSSHKEYCDSIEKMKIFVMKQKALFYEKIGKSDCRIEYNFDLEKIIACSMGEYYECPSNSSKLLAKMAPVRVLNPDIFFLFNKSPFSFYHENELIVYDEAQQIEGVMSRLFKKKLPISTIKRLFGIDMNHLYQIPDACDLLKQTSEYIIKELAPLLAAAKTIGYLGDICSVRNVDTLERIKSTTTIADDFRKDVYSFLVNMFRSNKNWSFSILEIVNYAFTDKKLPEEFVVFGNFIESVKSLFKQVCASLGCEDNVDIFNIIIPACKRYINGHNLDGARNKRTRPLKLNEIDFYEEKTILVSEDQIYADHINLFYKSTKDFVKSAMSLLSLRNDDVPSFIISPIMIDSIIACKDTPLYSHVNNNEYSHKKERCLEITPIAIGRLMNMLFYSKANKVLLSSGTWVCPESLYKIYGIPSNDVEFIKVPSGFDAKNRKIYVIDNKNFTNFSEKVEGGNSYIYKTEDGSKKFALELYCIINRVRNYIKNKHGKNANIIIHSHTFDITRRIAEYLPKINDSYLIHLGNYISVVNNSIAKYTVFSKYKDDMIQMIKDCPNSGLTLVSPSVSEGVDFKDDSARAQIILKKPTPYIGDVYIKSHCKGNPDIGINIDPDFIDRICYTIITQAYGRVMRDVNDWGYSIIMDQSITWDLKRLLKKRRRINDLNIHYFWDGIQVQSDKNGNPVFSWPFG